MTYMHSKLSNLSDSQGSSVSGQNHRAKIGPHYHHPVTCLTGLPARPLLVLESRASRLRSGRGMNMVSSIRLVAHGLQAAAALVFLSHGGSSVPAGDCWYEGPEQD